MNKKKSIALIAVIALVAVALIGTTLAYFTDTDEEKNTFTIGNVSIDLIESRFHRVNAGATTAGRLSWDTEDYPMNGTAGSAPGDAHGWTGAFYTDDQIKKDAETYQKDYLAVEGANMLPGMNVMKCPYVINTGANDAYVRVRVLVPKVLDDGILASSMYTSTAISSGAVTGPVVTVKTIGEVEYNEYAFTYVDPLAPKQMTFWNVWGDIKVGEKVTAEQIQADRKSVV